MNIVPLLEEKGISQRELARRMGKDAAYVNRLLKPGYDPRWSTVQNVAASIGVTINELQKEEVIDESQED